MTIVSLHTGQVWILLYLYESTLRMHSQTGKRQPYRGRTMVSRQKRASDDSVYILLLFHSKACLNDDRSHIKEDSQPLRDIISSSEFETYFGKAEVHPEGKRQNIFGLEDELKVAPKGVDKEHKDIDLLKCRSFVVVYRFSDSEVLDAEFGARVAGVVEVMMPFVHCLNDLMTV